MSSRRTFLGQVLGGTASLALRGWRPAAKGPSGSSRVLGASDRVRVGLIGAGGRGQEILKEAMHCPNTEAVAVADVYTRRHDEVKRFAPGIKVYTDFRRLLDDRSVDAVLIATPQHLHALHFVPALQAGKDVYPVNQQRGGREGARARGSGAHGTDHGHSLAHVSQRPLWRLDAAYPCRL